MNTKEEMKMCPDCSYTWSDLVLDTHESYRVFCPKHDKHKARYTDGRPLLDDRCPECRIEDAKNILDKILSTPSLYNGRMYSGHDMRKDIRTAITALAK